MPQINDNFIPATYDPSDPSTLLTRSLPLLPFQNQVGGHCSFFRFSKRAICKPMSHKEQEFYEYLEQHHAPILPFTSQYLGVVNVTYRSFNAQPMLPEVILAENQHLLANWKKYLHSSPSITDSDPQAKPQQQQQQQQQKQQQQQQQQPRRHHQRRHSSSYNIHHVRADSFDDREDSSSKHGASQAPQSPLTFKEQVLREVFSPDALQERLQQVQDWQRGMRQRQLDSLSADQIDNSIDDGNKNDNRYDDRLKCDDGQPRDSMKRSILQTSRSVLDFRRDASFIDSLENSDYNETTTATASTRQQLPAYSHDTPNHNDDNNNSSSMTVTNTTDHYPFKLFSTMFPMIDARVDSADHINDENSNVVATTAAAAAVSTVATDDDMSGDPLDALQVTVHPRRPTLIDSTTSAPQTPRMRETKLHNPHIRPPAALMIPTRPSPIPNLTSSSSSSSPSELSLSPTQMQSTPLNATGASSISSQQQQQQQQQQQGDRQQQDADATTTTTTTSESTSWRPRKEPTNPWSVQMYQRDLEKVNVDDTQQFILIEDLTDEIKYPCVLDLKMGTRQHGVYSTTTKMLSQTKKCERSTSLRLGVRISGMQVYNVNQGQFLFEDKYKGRSLTQQGFRDSLVRYFDNGQGCHILHLPTLIRKLVLIHRIIKTMDAFRFYASSLLIIYDAADTIETSTTTTTTNDNKKKRRIDVRLIDFAKSVTKHEWHAHHQEFTYPPEKQQQHQFRVVDQDRDMDWMGGPDQGYLLGVQSLISCFVWIYVHHGGKKEDLMDLDDALLFGDLPSWLDGDNDDDDDGNSTGDN